MSLPTAELFHARLLSADEAAVMAQDALVRAGIALRQGHRPPRKGLLASLPATPWLEGVIIGTSAIVCAVGYLAHPI